MSNETKAAVAAKLYIIIAGAIASGKTTLALNLAKAIPNCFYFDKDDLGPMAMKIFEVGGEKEYNRDGDFFKENVRDVEYDVAQITGLRGFVFNDIVIVNTPYTGELRRIFSGQDDPRLHKLHEQVRARGGELMVVFIEIEEEVAIERMMKRKKEDPVATSRTPDAFEDPRETLKKQNLKAPDDLDCEDIDHFFVFHASDPEGSFRRLKAYLGISSDTPYNIEISKERFMDATDTGETNA